MTQGVEQHHLAAAHNYFSGRTDAELSKTFHPNQDTLVTILAGRPDSPANRAEILVLVKKLLASTDPRMRNLILAKSAYETSAVEYALVKNKMEVARFLIEVRIGMITIATFELSKRGCN